MSGLLEEEHDPPEESLGDEPCAGEPLERVALLKDAPVPSSGRLIVGPFLKVAEALGRQHVEAVRELLIGLLLQATGRDDGVAPELEGLIEFQVRSSLDARGERCAGVREGRGASHEALPPC